MCHAIYFPRVEPFYFNSIDFKALPNFDKKSSHNFANYFENYHLSNCRQSFMPVWLDFVEQSCRKLGLL